MSMAIRNALKPLSLAVIFVLGTGLSGASNATAPVPTVESVIVGKGIENIQTSATNVQVDPTPQGPAYGGPYGFTANVDGQNVGSITAPVVSGPQNVGNPFWNNGKLLYNSTDGGWRLGSPNANDWGSPTLSDLNTKFNNGVYTFQVNGASIPLKLIGDAYPNTPILTLSGGTWSAGKYVLDVSQSLTITTNAFTAYGSHSDGSIWLGIDGGAYADQFRSTAPASSNFMSLTLPANSLTSGRDYNAGAEFRAVVDLNPNVALAGSYNAAYYSVYTGVLISAVPEPETYALMLAGLGLFGVVMRRRKVSQR